MGFFHESPRVSDFLLCEDFEKFEECNEWCSR
jgi:hypothetical protein